MPQPNPPLALGQINLVVRDLRKSIAFYRLLGLSIQEIPLPEWAPHHASGVTSNGVGVEFDSIAFAKQWNPGLAESRLGSATIPIFHVAARDDVDRVHARVTAAGYGSQKAPEDAFWGARYAIVEDPDGNAVGIMSPIDESMRRPPPPAPRGGTYAVPRQRTRFLRGGDARGERRGPFPGRRYGRCRQRCDLQCP
jgi:catechol 2,3-dioxygenase-like lactoylglutathione lyase family enzyme